MIIAPEYNNTNKDENESDTEVTSLPRRFPAIPQLIVLGTLLFFLLGSAGVSYLDQRHKLADDIWIDTIAEGKKLPSASLSATTIKPLEEIEIEAKAGFVYDVSNNRVLYQKSADETLPLASITKLMTTLVAHELLSEDSTIIIPTSATKVESASGLLSGEYLSSRSLINFALLASSNDAAISLANAGASAINANASEEIFIEAMNIRAKELGFDTLTFHNAHGLDISTVKAGAYGSARDVSFLLEYIYKNYPDLLMITTSDSALIYNEAGQYHNASNTNQALLSIPALRGSKTGYTLLAGGNLTVIFDAGYNHPVIITVLGSSFEGRFSDVLSLIEATKSSLTITQ